MSSSNTNLSTSGPAAPLSTVGFNSAPTAGQRRLGPPSQPCASCQTPHTCFYFTVFFSNNPPIFHSNRIPADLLGITPASTTALHGSSSATNLRNLSSSAGLKSGDGTNNNNNNNNNGNDTSNVAGPSACSVCAACRQRRWQAMFVDPTTANVNGSSAGASHGLHAFNTTKGGGGSTGLEAVDDGVPGPLVGDFRTETATFDEVPQQTLQTVAFPTAFGSCGGGTGGGGSCPLPVRKLELRTRRASSSASVLTGQRPTASSHASSTSASARQEEQQQQPSTDVRRMREEKEALEESSSKTSSGSETLSKVPHFSFDGDSRGGQSGGTQPFRRTRRFSGATSANTGSQLTIQSTNTNTNHSTSHTNGTHHSGAIVRLSPNTLPLTTTVSPNTTTTPATGLNGTANVSVVPMRFQPTFPLVKWLEDDDEQQKEGRNAAVRASEAAAAAAAAAVEVGDSTEAQAKMSEAVEEEKTEPRKEAEKAASGPAPASTARPAAAGGGVPVRVRRPRQRIGTAPASSLHPAAAAAGAGTGTLAHTSESPAPPQTSARPTTASLVTSQKDATLSGTTSSAGAAATAAPTAAGQLTAQAPPAQAARVPAASTSNTTTVAASAVAASPRAPAVPTTPTPPAGAASTPSPATTAIPTTTNAAAAASADASSTVHVLPVPVTQEGPPWNMRVEEVRSAKGELRYYRLILAVSFAALITSHTGLMHSMQTRNAATALVLTCPPSGVHFRFLLHHVDVLRSALNRTTEFAIRTVQRFFGLLFSPTQKPKGTQQQVLKGITQRLETHSEACETYRSVKAELSSALQLLSPLPLLAPTVSGWVVPVLMHSAFTSARGRMGQRGSGSSSSTSSTRAAEARGTLNSGASRNGGRRPRSSGASAAMSWLTVNGVNPYATTSNEKGTADLAAPPPPPPPLSEFLYEATAYLCEYSEGFASAFVCGLLSLAGEGSGKCGLRTYNKRLHTAPMPPAPQQQQQQQMPWNGLTGSTSNALDHAAAPWMHPSRVSSPTTATATAASTREPSAAYSCWPGVSAMTATPDWLSAYASYFTSVTAAPSDSDAQHDGSTSGDRQIDINNNNNNNNSIRPNQNTSVLEARAVFGEGDGWIGLSRPAAVSTLLQLPQQPPPPSQPPPQLQATQLASDVEDADVDACLRTHVSASTVSSITPVLSPMTVDVEVRSPSARLPRGRNLSSPSPAAMAAVNTATLCTHNAAVTNADTNTISNNNNNNNSSSLAAVPPTPTTAQLFTISPETSVTSHAATLAMSTATTTTTTTATNVQGALQSNNNFSNHHHNGTAWLGNTSTTTNSRNASTNEVASTVGLSRAQTSTAVSAMASEVNTAAPHPSTAPVVPAAATAASLGSNSKREGAAAKNVGSSSPRVASSPAPTPVPHRPPPPQPSTTTTPTSSAGSKEDEYALHRGRLGRVVIFTQDAVLARRLLLVSAFLWDDGSAANTATAGGAAGPFASPFLRGTGKRSDERASAEATSTTRFCDEAAQRMYETAVAAAVTSADFANVPIQWVPEEFSEARLNALCSRFSPENTLLVVVPRQLQCRRVSLRKHVAGTTVLVEQQAGKEARIRSPAFPFRCSIVKQTVLLPDPTVTTLLREARSLHQGSHGVVDFADVFQRMVRWLYWQSAAAVLKKRDVHLHTAAATAALQPFITAPTSTTAAAAAAAAAGAEPNLASAGSGGPVADANYTGLSRYASLDLLWPSRSVSAVGSRATTPNTVTPAAVPYNGTFPRLHTASSTTASASPASPAMALDQSLWAADSAEEVLLPGSCGGASAAWAYTTTPATAAVGGASSNSIPTGGAAGATPTTTAATSATHSYSGHSGLCAAVAAANDGTAHRTNSHNSIHTSTGAQVNKCNAYGGFSGGGSGACVGSAGVPTTSTLLISHGLLQPPSAFVTAAPAAPAVTTPHKSSSLRFLSWFKASPTVSTGPHFHPVLSPTTLEQLSAGEGGQLPRLLSEDDDFAHIC